MTHPRVQQVAEIAAGAGVDGVALIPGAHLRYITGIDFHLMERLLVIIFRPGADPVAVVPSLEADRLRATDIPFHIFGWTDTDGYAGALTAAAAELALDGKRLGVETLAMRLLEANALRGAIPGLDLVPADDALAGLRLHKSADEIAHLRAAIAISEAALQAVLDAVRPGMTEQQIAGLLVMEQLQRGGGAVPFEPIALTGLRAALPHGTPTDRAIRPGEPLLLDFGTTVGGYASDITRTFSFGPPSDRFKDVYAAVQAANAAGRAAARPGLSAQEVDRAARREIEAAGFGDYFTHRTGHGLGLQAHESPNIVEGNTQILEPGMVFTIEPGIYLPGEIGVRIEDDVVITADGCESLTTFTRELVQVGGG